MSRLAVFVLGVVVSAGAAAQDARPDFSGLWFPASPGGFARPPDPLPYTEGAQRLVEQYLQEFALDDDPGLHCVKPGLLRALWGAAFTVDVFHRDHDLTIYWEGYEMYRKIYMADQNPPPAPPIHTVLGHSLAHWEGDTLVIETTHLRPYPHMRRLANSSDARIVERMWLEEREVDGELRRFLVDEATLYDPKVYTEPIVLRAELTQRPGDRLLEYICAETLWDEYLLERGLTLPDLDAL